MSAVSLKLIAVLCLSCTALSGPESSGVVWRDVGKAVTIQCRCPEKDQDSLSLNRGRLGENSVLFHDGKSAKTSPAEEFDGRLQLNGVFPNLDILIKNLTSDDTGAYWCTYMKFDAGLSRNVEAQGSGAMLLVVTDKPTRCDQSNNNNLILVSVGICAATLFGIIICFLIWIILKTKTCTAKKPRRVANSEVYEDMRGTIRR